MASWTVDVFALNDVPTCVLFNENGDSLYTFDINSPEISYFGTNAEGVYFNTQNILSDYPEIGLVIDSSRRAFTVIPPDMFETIGDSFVSDLSAVAAWTGLALPSSGSSLSSLNGNYGSIPDGVVVVCYPSSRQYTVVSSKIVAYDKNSLTILYDLDSDGLKHSAPHEFLSIVEQV